MTKKGREIKNFLQEKKDILSKVYKFDYVTKRELWKPDKKYFIHELLL